MRPSRPSIVDPSGPAAAPGAVASVCSSPESCRTDVASSLTGASFCLCCYIGE